ncbi:hypothetical protein GGS21DRAFT_241967 [Xylaria nigripes]|nr:hypothetical protein GGS21DRAFT_241967 [Xylaria nigripes]
MWISPHQMSSSSIVIESELRDLDSLYIAVNYDKDVFSFRDTSNVRMISHMRLLVTCFEIPVRFKSLSAAPSGLSTEKDYEQRLTAIVPLNPPHRIFSACRLAFHVQPGPDSERHLKFGKSDIDILLCFKRLREITFAVDGVDAIPEYMRHRAALPPLNPNLSREGLVTLLEFNHEERFKLLKGHFPRVKVRYAIDMSNHANQYRTKYP